MKGSPITATTILHFLKSHPVMQHFTSLDPFPLGTRDEHSIYDNMCDSLCNIPDHVMIDRYKCVSTMMSWVELEILMDEIRREQPKEPNLS